MNSLSVHVLRNHRRNTIRSCKYVYVTLYNVGCYVAAAGGAPAKVLTGDLDSSLASLAENLTMNKPGQPPK